MNSDTLIKLGFCSWEPFENEVVKTAPKNRGCYAFRSLIPQSLKKGSSDIMYIGRAMGIYHNVQHSLNQYLHPGKGKHGNLTKIRVGEKALTSGWQVSWKQTDSADQVECQLLQCFYEEHDQLPPENKSWPGGCCLK